MTAPRPNIIQDMDFHGPHSTIRKRLTENPSFTGMRAFVNSCMRAESTLGSRKDGIEIRFLDVGFETIDISKRCVGIDGGAVGPKAYDVSVDLMYAPELQMAIAFPSMIDVVPVGDLG